MAHSKPSTLLNKGDAERATIAVGCFIIELCTDYRVNKYYEGWYHARQRATDLLKQAARSVDAQTHKGMLDAFHVAELAGTKEFVVKYLQLDAWADWVALCLIEAFEVRVHNDAHPDDERKFGVPVQMRTGAPLGRQPRNDGQDIMRNVRWFYRHKVKVPIDTIHDIARDYASYDNRDNDCRSVVQNGVAQAQGLLDLARTSGTLIPKV